MLRAAPITAITARLNSNSGKEKKFNYYHGRKIMRKFLLYSSALAVFGLSSSVAEAACIQTPTCSSLGYTSTSSCTGGTKCPFGNYWNCTAGEIKTELTNKITELEKIIEEIKQNSSSNSDILSNCKIGDILYSDKSCDPNVIASKIPIGVVFDRANKLAIGLEQFSESWAIGDFDVPGLSNITSSSAAIADWQGKNNTRLVLECCKANGKSCTAFEYVNSYKTAGTQAGDWYLPALGELNAIYGSKGVLDIALGKIKGTKLEASKYHSSSEGSYRDAWGLNFHNGYVEAYGKGVDLYVRPVIDYGAWANSSAGDEDNETNINFDCSSCEIGDIMYRSRCYDSYDFHLEVGYKTIPEGYVVDKSQNKCFYFRDSPDIGTVDSFVDYSKNWQENQLLPYLRKAYETAQFIPFSILASTQKEKNYYIRQDSSTYGSYELLYFTDYEINSEYIKTTNPSTYQIEFYVLQSF